MGIVQNVKDNTKLHKTWDLLQKIPLDKSKRDANSIDAFISMLADKSDEEIFDFDYAISLMLNVLDGPIFAYLVYGDTSKEDISADDFLAIRCGAVVKGEDYYYDLLDYAKILDIEDKFLELLSIPSKAWAKKNGTPVEDYPYNAPIPIESFCNEKNWNENLYDQSLEFNRFMLAGDVEQLRLFAKEVVKNEEIWIIISTDEEEPMPLMYNYQGEAAPRLLIWPKKEFAEAYYESDDLPEYSVEAFDLFAFLTNLLPAYIDNHILPAALNYNDNYLDYGWSSIKRAIYREILAGQNIDNFDSRKFLSSLGRGEITIAAFEYALDRILDESLDLNDRESEALINGLTIKKIAVYYNEGWPETCGRCGCELDYSDGWRVAFGNYIVCKDCYEKYEKENLNMDLEIEEEFVKNFINNPIDTTKMMKELRSSYENNKDIDLDIMISPEKLMISSDTVFNLSQSVFDQSKELLKNGKIVYGCLVQTPIPLFIDYDDDSSRTAQFPTDLIYSLDPYYEENVDELSNLSDKLFSYKMRNINPLEAENIASYLSSEENKVMHQILPKELTGGRDVYLTSSTIQRNHLPQLKIFADILPVLVDPENFSTCLVLPKRHWTKDFTFFHINFELLKANDDSEDDDE